jgi:chromatin structure-remodeling complex subunit RSC9
MRCCFEEDPNADITQIQLWQAYQQRFSEYVQRGLPLLPAADFIKHVSIAFKNAGAKVVEVGPGQTRFIIRGIRPRESPLSPRGLVYLPCKWLYHHGQCKTQVLTANDLYTHVISTHLPHHDNSDGQPSTPPVLHCGWNGCNRFGQMGCTDRRAVIAHLRTHMPDKSIRAKAKQTQMPRNPQNKLEFEVQVPMIDGQGRAAILPLTIVLALRNFGKSPDGRELLYPHRDFLCRLAASVGAAQYGRELAKYLMELFVDSDLDPREKDDEEDGVQA